jgi:hypothetical protein
MTRLYTGTLALIGALILVNACGGPAPASNGSSSSPQQTSGQAAGTGKTTAGAGASKVNMEEIFPAGPGRDLVLNNCQNCHTFVPIVVLQMEEDAWTRSSVDHRPRVTGLTDEEFNTVYTYLKANFNPNRPVPTLPKELLESWTTY